MANKPVPQENRIAFKWNDNHIFLPKIVISQDLRRKADQYINKKNDMTFHTEKDWDPDWDDDEDDGIKDFSAPVSSHNPLTGLSIKEEQDSDIDIFIRPCTESKTHKVEGVAQDKLLDTSRKKYTADSTTVGSSKGDLDIKSEFFKRKFYNKNELFRKWKGDETTENTTTEKQCVECGITYGETDCAVCPHRRNKLAGGSSIVAETKANELKCIDCGKIFTKRIHLTLHMKIHAKMGKQKVQPIVEKSKCSFCQLLFNTNHELAIHFRQAHYKNYFDSQNTSSNETASNKNLSTWSHCATQVLKEGVDPVTCDKCGKTFSNEDYLNQHKVVHERVPLSCLFCGETFTSNSSLMTHMLIHDEADNTTRFGCTRCGRRFGRQNQLNFHVKFCKVKFQYPAAAKQLNSNNVEIGSMKKTVDQANQNEKQVESLEEEEDKQVHSKFRCIDCGREFNRINYLNFHKKIHFKFCSKCTTHIHEKEYEDHVESCTAVADPVAEIHNSSIQSVSAEKNLPCDICGKLFTCGIKLSQHCLTHAFSFDTFVDVDSTDFQSMLPLLCEYSECRRRFSDNVDLANHVQKHLPQDSLCCEVCGRNFNLKSSLISHRSSAHNLYSSSKKQLNNDAFSLTTENLKVDTSTSKPTFYYMQNGCPPSPNPYVLITKPLKEHADKVFQETQLSCTFQRPAENEITKPILLDRNPTTKSRGMRCREDIPFQNLYICKICGRRFKKNKRNHYINHLWYHNNESKFGCHLCDRKFCNENLLNAHVQKHSDPNYVNRTGRRFREDVPIQDIYECKLCDKRFPKQKRSQYFQHLYIHKQEAQFGCNLCERKFLNQNLLTEHLERHADPTYRRRAQRQSFPVQDIYVCEICDRRFPKQKRHQYIHHVWVHKREDQFGCHLCERKFWSANLLDEHVKKHSDPNFVSRVGRRFRADIPIQDLYICEICDRRFTKQKRQQYLSHLSMHKRENQFVCHLCERKFVSQNSLDEHVKKHSDPNYVSRTGRPFRNDIPIQEVYNCEICERRFPRQRRKQYIHHLWTHQREAKFGCHLCQRKFYSQSTLNVHLSRHKDGTFHARPGRPVRKDIPFQDVYTCPKCNNKFTNRHGYLIHLYQHNKQNKFKCKYCYKSFVNRHLLSQHVVKHADPNFSNRPGRGGRQDIPVQDVYYCEECGDGKPYSERQKFILHVRSHELGRKFECPHCPRHFTNEGNLRYHVEIHKNVKKHQCNDCLKMFKTKDARKSHQEKFCKKVPCKYKCNRCCDRFHSKLMLSRHAEKEHPQQTEQETSSDIEYPCQNCSQTFNTTFGLTRHIQIYHPSTAVTFSNEVYDSKNVEMNEGEINGEAPAAGNVETFGEDKVSTHSDWNPSDPDHSEGDEFNITDMLATSFCETEMTVEEPVKQPGGRKARAKISRGTCQCGVIKKYKSQIFCHNRQCPCVQKGRKCSSKCLCKTSCLNTNDREHEQQQKFKESKEKMLLEQQSEQGHAYVSHSETIMFVPHPVVHIQQTEFSSEINAATSLSYSTLVPSEFISLSGEADASIQQLSLSGYVEGEEDCDPLSDPLQSTTQISSETNTFNSGLTSSVNPPTTSASEPGTSESSILISALNSQPNQSLILSCQFCGTNKKNFRHISTYISHMLGHVKEKGGFKCPICKKNLIFNDAISLVRHVDTHNKGTNLQCKKCSSKFQSYKDMDKHLRVHHYKPMECGVCAIKFPTSHEMMSHWSQKHPTCQCGVCNLKFFSYEDLTSHMKDIHSPVDCINCSMQFENVDELIIHFTAKHNQPQPRPMVSSTSTYNQADRMSFCDALMSFMNCGYCNKKFTNSDDLNEHLYTHLSPQGGNSSTNLPSSEKEHRITTNLSCNECGATYNNIDDLTEHLTNHLQQSIYGKHMQPTQEPVSSQSKVQKESHRMEIDDNNIEAVEAITCPQCPKTFNSKPQYAQHIKSHNIEICTSCYSIFDSRHDLREHFQTSTCTVFECDICTKTFSGRRYLNQHKNRVHKASVVISNEETERSTGFQMKTPIIVASTSLAPQGLSANPQQFQNSHQQQEIEEIFLE